MRTYLSLFLKLSRFFQIKFQSFDKPFALTFKYYYFEYNSTIRCSSIGRSISSLLANLTTLPLNFSLSFSNQAGTGLAEFSSTFAFIVALSFLISLTVITSPAFTKYDGISTLLPFTSNCPWFTNCLA